MGANFVLDKGYRVDASQATNIARFSVVKLFNSTNIVSSGVASEAVLGVSQESAVVTGDPQGRNDALSGRIIDVRLMGITRVIATGVIALGAPVVSNGDGTVKTGTAAGAAQNKIGIALMASAATGDQIDVLLTPGVGPVTL
jgi:hypothetical protein